MTCNPPPSSNFSSVRPTTHSTEVAELYPPEPPDLLLDNPEEATSKTSEVVDNVASLYTDRPYLFNLKCELYNELGSPFLKNIDSIVDSGAGYAYLTCSEKLLSKLPFKHCDAKVSLADESICKISKLITVFVQVIDPKIMTSTPVEIVFFLLLTTSVPGF